MFRKLCVIAGLSVAVAAVACGDSSKNPSSPSGISNGSVKTPTDADAASDGSTLKVKGPELVAPANNATTDADFKAVLRINPAVAKYTSGVQFRYRFQLLDGSTVIQEFSTAGLTWAVSNLGINKTYGWRARAELNQNFGPWSTVWTLKTPDQPEGYIRPGEVYDPLINGKTIGRRFGRTTFIPGKGLRIDDQTGHVEYLLPQTMTTGEMSVLVTGLRTNTEGGKTKIMAMREGRSDITTNPFRMTVEKRGEPAGTIAWRFITTRDQVDTVGRQRVEREFNPTKTYLWQATWRNGWFVVKIWDGGAGGRLMYQFGKPYEGVYRPNPHYAYAGGPMGRAGLSSGSVDGMILRHYWLSTRPRPAFANR
jgi:hypothetical protein